MFYCPKLTHKKGAGSCCLWLDGHRQAPVPHRVMQEVRTLDNCKGADSCLSQLGNFRKNLAVSSSP